MISYDKITEIFCLVDDFCREFDKVTQMRLFGTSGKRPSIISKGEIINFIIAQANIDDRAPLKDKSFVEKIFGKLYADKEYIGKELMQMLFVDGIHLVTRICNNMKSSLMTMADKILLRKRSIIEAVNDELKNICQVEHSRHRSFGNFITNLVSGLIAYSFLPKKPSIKFQTITTNQLSMF